MNVAQIKQAYGGLIAAAAVKWNIRPEVIGGIIRRESEGRADVLGDAGHGHGLMQIDDRSYPEFCNSDNWANPTDNINQGCGAFAGYRKQVMAECEKFSVAATEEDIERMSIAAFNCGADNAVHCFRHGEDIDNRTTGKDYSCCVLEFAAEYFSA